MRIHRETSGTKATLSGNLALLGGKGIEDDLQKAPPNMERHHHSEATRTLRKRWHIAARPQRSAGLQQAHSKGKVVPADTSGYAELAFHA